MSDTLLKYKLIHDQMKEDRGMYPDTEVKE